MVNSNHSKIFKKKKTLFQKVISFIRGNDFYGKDIVLTYKGDDKYRTNIGGMIS